MRYPVTTAAAALLVLLSTASPGRTAEGEAVNRAIDRGVAALKLSLNGTVKSGGLANRSARGYARMSAELQTGVIALGVLTLLECGVPADDPAVRKNLPALRQASITGNHTYTLAVLVLLFDRLGDAEDVPLIHAMALRLLAGQYYAGGWSYYCPPTPADEAKRLGQLLKERTAEREARKEPAPVPRPPSAEEIEGQMKKLVALRRDVTSNPANFQGRGDDSNTQFAVLGLWAARRHGIPVKTALADVAARLRKSQNTDGGWGYVPSAVGEANLNTGSTPSMTCAALMVLAMSHVAATEGRKGDRGKDLGDDTGVRQGFAYLAGGIGVPIAPQGKTQTGYYYLWSMERVGIGYDLKTIGNKDWYAWGSMALVASQGGDGYWQREYGAIVDTSFALLFLKRVNLVPDVTSQLQGTQSLGRVGDSSGSKSDK